MTTWPQKTPQTPLLPPPQHSLSKSTIVAIIIHLKTAFHPALALIASRTYASLINPLKRITARGQTCRLFDGVVINLTRMHKSVATELYTLHHAVPTQALVDAFADYLNTTFIMPTCILALFDTITPAATFYDTCQQQVADLVTRHNTSLYTLYTFFDATKATRVLYMPQTAHALITELQTIIKRAEIQLVPCSKPPDSATITLIVITPPNIVFPDPEPHMSESTYTALKTSTIMAAASKYICTHADAFILQIWLATLHSIEFTLNLQKPCF